MCHSVHMFVLLVLVQSSIADPYVVLTSNVTLEGDICPLGVHFDCSVQNYNSSPLVWSFDNRTLVTYSPEEDHVYPYNLCDGAQDEDPLLKEICSYHGEVMIVNATHSGNNDTYNIFSTFDVRAYFINDDRATDYSSVSCGTEEINATLDTNFTVLCNDSAIPMVTLNVTSFGDSDECLVGAELTCVGTDLQSFSWSYDNSYPLSETYTYNFIADNFPLELDSSLPGVSITIDTAYSRNDYINRFNLTSTVKITESFDSNHVPILPLDCGSPEYIAAIILYCPPADGIATPIGKLLTGAIATFLILSGVAVLGVICTCIGCLLWKLNLKPHHPTPDDEESSARAFVLPTVLSYLSGNEVYSFEKQLGDIGTRRNKYWFEVFCSKDGNPQVLSIVPVSRRCALKLNSSTIKTLNKLCTTITKKNHPYVHSVHRIDYITRTGHVIVIQDKHSCGSLKDELYGRASVSSWSKDAASYVMHPLSISDVDDPVSLFGRQILQGLKFFYDQEFPPLGHVHSGNIYIHVDEEGRKVCKVGGYDNTLLGFKAKLHNSGVNMDMIDIVMFGHVIYEMAEGKSFSSAVPNEYEYKDSPAPVVEVLKFIFGLVKNASLSHHKALNKIMQHPFFKHKENLPSLTWSIINDPTGAVSSLLEKVTRGEPAQQEPVRIEPVEEDTTLLLPQARKRKCCVIL